MTQTGSHLLQLMCRHCGRICTPRNFLIQSGILAFWAPSCFASHGLEELSLEELLNVEVSSASRYAQTVEEAPATVAVIDRHEIEQHRYDNLADALNTVPGLYLSNDRTYNFLGVRGFNRPGDYNTRILLLTNGSRRNDPLYDQANIGNESPIDIDWVKRIEFVAGPASSVYGANALFGTINTQLLEGSDINGSQSRVSLGTNNSRKASIVAGHKTNEEQEWFFGLSAYTTDREDLYFSEFSDTAQHGHVNGLDREDYQKLYANYRFGRWKLAGNYSRRNKPMVTAPWGTVFAAEGTFTRDQQSLLELSYTAPTSSTWQPSLRLFRGQYQNHSRYAYEDDDGAPISGRDLGAADWHGIDAHLGYQGIQNHRFLFGIDWQKNTRIKQLYTETDSTGFTESYIDENHPSDLVSLFAQDEWLFAPNWRANLSIRHDKHSDYDAETSPRIALIWQASRQLTLKALTGWAYRVPNAYERYYNDGGVTQIANESLAPEKIHTTELSAIYKTNAHTQYGLSIYHNEIRNLIDLITDEDGVSQFINRERVNAQGIEFNGEYRTTHGYALRGNIQWQKSKLASGDTLVDSPRWQGKLIGEMPLPHRWQLAGEIVSMSRREGVNGPVSGFSVANLTLQSPKQTHGQYTFRIRNLTDKKYASPAASNLTQRSVIQPRRQIELTWTLPF